MLFLYADLPRLFWFSFNLRLDIDSWIEDNHLIKTKNVFKQRRKQMSNQQDSFNQEIEVEKYTGLKLFSIWCGLVLLALSFWAVIFSGLFSIKYFVEYLINMI